MVVSRSNTSFWGGGVLGLPIAITAMAVRGTSIAARHDCSCSAATVFLPLPHHSRTHHGPRVLAGAGGGRLWTAEG